MRANFVLSGVVLGIRRNVTMTIALVLSTAIALGFVGAAILANTEITRFRTTYQNKLDLQIYLCTNINHDQQVEVNHVNVKHNRPPIQITCPKNRVTTPQQTDTIRSALSNDPNVESFTYVSAQDSLKLARRQQPTVAKYLQVGDFPASFSVKLRDVQKDYPEFARKYGSMQGVDQVNNQIDTINTLLNLIDSARWFSIVVALIVLGASILLIANTIQVAAAQRRNETSIMRLVGASRWMTELPFMIETIIAVVIGGLISIGLIQLGKHYVLDNVFAGPTANGVIPNLDVNDVLIAGGIGVGVGIVLSALTAFATLRFYVRL